MLPGFRFLLAAIVLSMSVLIFGLGATALLRTAHQEFATTPSWQPAPETRFAQQEAPMPVLAMLRVEPAAEETKTSETKASEQTVAAAAPTDAVAAISTAIASPAAEPENAALPALLPTLELAPSSGQPQPTDKPAALAEATPIQTSANDAASPTVIPVAPTVDATKIPDAIRIASNSETTTPTAGTPNASTSGAAPQVVVAPPQQVAVLDNPATTMAPKPPTKIAAAKPDKSALRKRLLAQRALQRRRIAARARLAAAKQAQTPVDPFAAPAPAAPAR